MEAPSYAAARICPFGARNPASPYVGIRICLLGEWIYWSAEPNSRCKLAFSDCRRGKGAGLDSNRAISDCSARKRRTQRTSGKTRVTAAVRWGTVCLPGSRGAETVCLSGSASVYITSMTLQAVYPCFIRKNAALFCLSRTAPRSQSCPSAPQCRLQTRKRRLRHPRTEGRRRLSRHAGYP